MEKDETIEYLKEALNKIQHDIIFHQCVFVELAAMTGINKGVLEQRAKITYLAECKRLNLTPSPLV